jgi:hypothetical protein
MILVLFLLFLSHQFNIIYLVKINAAFGYLCVPLWLKNKEEIMIHEKKERKITLMILLVFIFSFSSFMLANEEYKIVSYNGKVKVKKNDEVVHLKKKLYIYLNKNDAVMVYPDAAIEMVFPDGKKKTFTGPFYSTVESLEKPFDREQLSFFGKPGQWKALERIFDEEGEVSAGATKGTQEASLNFYDEIKPVVAKVKIEDKALVPSTEEEMKEILETVGPGFNAFPQEKQMVIRSLVYKFFGWYKTALDMIFAHYKGILYTKGKQAERELIEDYLFNEFLPIVITIMPNEGRKKFPKGMSSNREIYFNKTLYSNFRLWWAAFSYDGRELKPIEKTIDYSLHPENTFKLNKAIAINNTGNRTPAIRQGPCFFIVACADWTELEKFDDMEYARRELLENSLEETGSTTIREYGKVIIKLCL